MYLYVSKGILQALSWGIVRRAKDATGLCSIWTHAEAGRGTGQEKWKPLLHGALSPNPKPQIVLRCGPSFKIPNGASTYPLVVYRISCYSWRARAFLSTCVCLRGPLG